MKRTNHYENPRLRESVATEAAEMAQHALVDARTFAGRGKPDLRGDQMRNYWEPAHHGFQQVINKVRADIPHEAAQENARAHGLAMEDRLRALGNEAGAIGKEEAGIDARLKNRPRRASRGRLAAGALLMAAIGLSEGTASIPTWENFAVSLLGAVLIGFLFAVVITAIAHFFVRTAALGRTRLQRRLIAICLAALLIVLFAWMGASRSDYLSRAVNAANPAAAPVRFSPLPFVFISVLLFCAALMTRHFMVPGDDEIRALLQSSRLKLAKRAAQARLARIETERESILAEGRELGALAESMRREGENLETEVIHAALAAYSRWKMENESHRSTGRPDCFDQLYPFRFVTNFLELKRIEDEN